MTTLTTDPELAQRLEALERRLRLTQAAALGVPMLMLAAAAAGSPQGSAVQDQIRARHIEIVDDQGALRISLGQDPKDTQRRSRACGITFIDTKGYERGGMGTMDDLSAVLALDAPGGVGGPMPDRIGMMVSPDGTAQLALIDNEMRVPVRLVADAQGGGGLELFEYDDEQHVQRTKRITFGGESVSEEPLEDDR